MTFVDVLWSLFHLLKGMFAEGNVCANGACDRVMRVVRCRGTSDAEALRDDARWCCPAAEFFVTKLC